MSETFTRIVFLQDDENFDSWAAGVAEYGIDYGLDYLTQWEYGQDDDTHETSARGCADDYYTRDVGDFVYVMSWNDRLRYVGLERQTKTF